MGAKHYTREFKLIVVQYYNEHPKCTYNSCADVFGVSHEAIRSWVTEFNKTGDIRLRTCCDKDAILKQWADKIKECEDRPISMTIPQWCEQQGITHDTYKYRVKQVSQAGLLKPKISEGIDGKPQTDAKSKDSSSNLEETKQKITKSLSLKEWSKLIKDCESRPHSIAIKQWCKEHGTTVSNYYYWRRRVLDAGLLKQKTDEQESTEQVQETKKAEIPDVQTYDREFKLKAVKYCLDHPEINLGEIAKKFGVGHASLYRWLKYYRETGDVIGKGGMGKEYVLQQWAKQVKQCLSRPKNQSLEQWCRSNKMSVNDYQYKLREVTQAGLLKELKDKPIKYDDVKKFSKPSSKDSVSIKKQKDSEKTDASKEERNESLGETKKLRDELSKANDRIAQLEQELQKAQNDVSVLKQTICILGK
jgi:transposase-like protein